jgi:hypothetical protein
VVAWEIMRSPSVGSRAAVVGAGAELRASLGGGHGRRFIACDGRGGAPTRRKRSPLPGVSS